MSALTNWAANNEGSWGSATFSVAGRVVAVRLSSYDDAVALNSLFDLAEKLTADRVRRSAANYIRGVAGHLEAAVG